jgi:hypothetical protein
MLVLMPHASTEEPVEITLNGYRNTLQSVGELTISLEALEQAALLEIARKQQRGVCTSHCICIVLGTQRAHFAAAATEKHDRIKKVMASVATMAEQLASTFNINGVECTIDDKQHEHTRILSMTEVRVFVERFHQGVIAG